MQKIIIVALVLLAHLAWGEESPVKVQILLSPAGSFVAQTSDLKGFVTREGAIYRAKDVTVNLKNLKTGIDLRDRHTQKHLETDKYPDAILTLGEGQGGKGTGKIKIHGKEVAISGTYEIKDGKKMLAKFPLHLADFDITGVKYMSVGVKDQVNVEVLIPIQSTAPVAAPAAK